MLTRRAIILGKIESTYNTDSSPVVSTDAALVEEPSWSHEGARMQERAAARPSAGKLPQVFGGTLKAVSFSMNLKGAGAAYSATVRPEADAFLRACGFSATVDTTASAETVTYVPVSTAYESITIYYYEDGILHTLTGCRGNVSFAMEAGGFVKASFSFTGHDATHTDVSFPSPTYDSVAPPVFMGMSFAVAAYSATIQTLDYDMGNVIATPASANAADGYADIEITGRDPGGSFDPERVLIATNDPIALWKAGTTLALATGLCGDTQYNRFSQSMPAIYYREISPGDRDGINTLGNGFGMSESTTDDEVTLLFT